MKAQLITWALVALGLALVVQVLGPILIGCLLAYILFRFVCASGNRG